MRGCCNQNAYAPYKAFYMIIVQFIDSLAIGGSEIVAMNIAASLQARGHKCVVCGIGSLGVLGELLERKGVQYNCMNTPHGFSLVLIMKIFKSLSAEKADVVVTHHFRQLIHAFLPAKILGKKLVHIEHDYHFYENKPVILKRLSFLIRFVDSFVCVSSEILDCFRGGIYGIEQKSVFINNGVDTDRFRPDGSVRGAMRNKYGIAPDSFVVGTCARLEPIKNIALLLNGFAEFQKDHDNAQLIVVGDGSQMQELQNLAKQLGVEQRVIFTGVQYEVEKYLAMFDVYAITSQDEGMPLSVLEAMATGLPVVGTNVGALPQMVTNQTGILLRKAAPDDVSNALSMLYADKSARFEKGKNSRQFVLEKYSLDRMIEQYQALFERAGQPDF